VPYGAADSFDLDIHDPHVGEVIGVDGQAVRPSSLLVAEQAGHRGSSRLKLADPFTPVTCEGIPATVAQAQATGNNAKHYFVCSGASSTAISTVLDS
jgi:hypothetical protein